MPAPKSVTKVTKEGVTFTSNVNRAEYQMFELTRGALRDVAKFVAKQWRLNFYKEFKKHTGEATKSIRYKIYSGKSTKYPRVEIGLPKSAPNKKVDGWYAWFQEFGSQTIKKKELLRKTVRENVATIREIESKYLSYINLDDIQIQSKIDEKEEEGE